MSLSLELLASLQVTSGPDTSSSGFPAQVRSYRLTEGLSQIPELSLVVEVEHGDYLLSDLLRKEATFGLRRAIDAEEDSRWFHGIVVEAEELEEVGNMIPYRLKIVPTLWLTKRSRNSRIFQDITVTDVISEVLQPYGIDGSKLELLASATYPQLDYCVQYEESDYAFVCRLMEQVGAFFWFEHSDGEHVLKIGDSNQDFGTAAAPTYDYEPPSSSATSPHIFRFRPSKEVRPGKVSLLDHRYKPPGAVDENYSGSLDDDLEVYEQPGGYPDVNIPADGAGAQDSEANSQWGGLPQVRHEELAVRAARVRGESTIFGMCPGGRFTVDFPGDYNNNDFDEGTEYLLTRVVHVGEPGEGSGPGSSGPALYSNSYRVIPNDVAYRPRRRTPTPRLAGVQTALVTLADGSTSPSSGSEVEVDKLGRVHVRFHWDRRDTSEVSCWMRVGQSWAGNGFGQVFIPRVGTEVIVQFVNGNPDRPMITGTVFNGSTALPMTLPADKYHSVIRSQSATDAARYNELRFEDNDGSERVYLQAEKNHEVLVKNNMDSTVGNDQELTVKNDQRTTVENDRFIQVVNNFDEDIGGNEDRETAGDQLVTVHGTETRVTHKEQTHTVNANRKLDVTGKVERTIGAGEKIDVTGGQEMKITGDQKVEVSTNQTSEIGGNQTFTVLGAINHEGVKGINLVSPLKIVIDAPLVESKSAVEKWYKGVVNKGYAQVGKTYGVVLDQGALKFDTVGAKVSIFAADVKTAGFYSKTIGSAEVKTAATVIKNVPNKIHSGAFDLAVNANCMRLANFILYL